MEIKNLNIEQLVELRTKMILEGQKLDEINSLIESKEIEYSSYIKEDSGYWWTSWFSRELQI
jgi:hypothetical protein